VPVEHEQERDGDTRPSASSTQAVKPSHRMAVLGSLVATLVVFDQATKAIVRATLPLYDSVIVIPGFLSLTHVRNTGAAFGFLNGVQFPFKAAVMTLISLVALVGIILYGIRATTNQPVSQMGLALVVGGAIGNLIDRMTAGHVVDFVDVYWRGWHFWAFNAADAGISIGAALLIIDMIRVDRHVSTTA